MTPDDPTDGLRQLRVRDARLITLPRVRDVNGTLVWSQLGLHLPFAPRRVFFVDDVPRGAVRGEHAHGALEEVLVCVRGSCSVTLDDGVARDEVVLSSACMALYIPAMTWSTQRNFSADALLAVLASEVYRPEDYIRDYTDFAARRSRG